ncbi:MAG: trifunctional transcriptional regulator/proline dehydrogenase/L-glutamate gamma-semialdehyde dehydrogenase, partial [Castellaniella sp.]
MATVTLGVKVDEALRERLRALADSLGCTPHWLHKQALLSYIEAIERGQLPAEIDRRPEGEPAVEHPVEPEPLAPFHEFAQEVLPQSVLRAAITAAYRRPEPECVAMLVDLAESSQPDQVEALARRLVQTLRDKRKGGGVEGLIQEFS